MDLLSGIEKPNLPFIINSDIKSSYEWDEQLNIFKIQIPNGVLLYSHNFFSADVGNRALRYLQENQQYDENWDDWSSISTDEFSKLKFSNINWKQDHISLYGKTSALPRLTAWYGDAGRSYQYSGIGAEPNPWNQGLLYIKKEIEKMASTSFNSVLLNWYRTGEDHLGWHADDEKELGHAPTIGSVNLGETRDFILRRNDDKSKKIKIPLGHGSVLIMSGEIQEFWQHSVPKRKKVARSRINLTFREIL